MRLKSAFVAIFLLLSAAAEAQISSVAVESASSYIGLFGGLNFLDCTVAPQSSVYAQISCPGTSTGTVSSISAGTGVTLTPNPIVTTGSVALTVPVTAILGGTGQVLYAVGDVLYADTTTTLAKLADVANIHFLRSKGVSTAPAYSTSTWPDAFTQGDLVYASGAATVSTLADTAIGAVLTSQGVGATPAYNTPGATGTVLRAQTGATPVFGQVVLTTDVTGILPVANGGTATATPGITFGPTPVFTGGATASGSTLFDMSGSSGGVSSVLYVTPRHDRRAVPDERDERPRKLRRSVDDLRCCGS